MRRPVASLRKDLRAHVANRLDEACHLRLGGLTGASKQAVGMSKPPMPKVFQTTAGRVIVEPKSGGDESIRLALADPMAQVSVATSEASALT